MVNAMSPDLHRAVRSVFREVLSRDQDPRLAFDDAVIVLGRHRPSLSAPEARKAVALMLSTDPAVHLIEV
jgi:hypothetical protein